MDELSSKSKDLLSAFKADATPGPQAVDAALASVQRNLPTARPQGASMSLAAKVAVVGLAVSVAVAAWLASSSDPAPVVARSAPDPAAAVIEEEPAAPTTRLAPAVVEESESPAEKAPVTAQPPRKTTRGVAPDTKSQAPAGAPDDDLPRQMKLVADARAALKAGNHERALSLLSTYAVDFPKGSFAEQAAALKVDALCGLRRDEDATKAAQRFLRRWPRSPSAARVRQACSERRE